MKRSDFVDEKPKEWVVDNEDEAFRLYDPLRDKWLKQWVEKKRGKVYLSNERGSVTLHPGQVSSWYLDEGAYGDFVFSSVLFEMGTGCYMEWETLIKEKGTYELWVHLPVIPRVARRGEKVNVKKNKEEGMEWKYVVTHEAETKEFLLYVERPKKQTRRISFAEAPRTWEFVPTGEWKLLGRMDFKKGRCVVRLTDHGEKGHFVFGDAVKWKRVE